MAEVFGLDDDRVVKLDRPEWNGVSEFEEHVLQVVCDAGLPAPRPRGTVTIEGRCGVVMDRVPGQSLDTVVASAAPSDVDVLAERFATLHYEVNSAAVDGLPDLIERLGPEVERSGLPRTTIDELLVLLDGLDDRERRVCHFDLHPGNILVTDARWTVIDWLGAASGPSDADFARSQVLHGDTNQPSMARFLREARRCGQRLRGLDDETCNAWIRIVAAARVAEGFDGSHAAWLRDVAAGTRTRRSI
jgi:aminoglycoside phosphotransferase (APT) family kinase protein